MLKSYLKPHAVSMVMATIYALVLGIVTAVVFSMIGPSLQVLTLPQADTVVKMDQLFGDKIGQFLAMVSGRTSILAGQLWVSLPYILIALATVRAILGTAQWYAWEKIGEIVSRDLRADLVSAYVYLDPVARLENQNADSETGLSSAIGNDIKLIREYIVHYYGGFPRELFQIIFLMVTLILLSPKLFLIFFVVVAPAGAVISRLGKKLRKRAGKVLEDFSNLNEWLQQRLLGVETIKHYRTEGVEITRFKDLTTALNHRYLKAARLKARTSPMMEMFGIIAMVVVLYLALRETGSHEFAGGVQLAFFSSLAMLVQAASKVGKYYNANKEGKAALRRLEDQLAFLKSHSRFVVTGFQERDSQFDPLTLQNISVTYKGATEFALNQFSFSFSKGKIYCLMGPSGAGKSTLVNVILGIVKPQTGSITVSSAVAKCPMPILYMPQNIRLSPGTVGENIAYPAQTWDDAKAWQALADVDLKSVVEKMPQGLNTILGRDGQGMSGGQSQRIQLARLIYHHAPIILVDEGTSALDPEIEKAVYALIQKMAHEGATILMIAHRPSALKIADEVIVLQNGRLHEHGAPSKVKASPTLTTLS